MSPSGRGASSTHARIFRALLRLYPASFREPYGDEMVDFFLARLARAREGGGALSVARLWSRTVMDLAASAIAERRVLRTRRTPPTRGDSPMFLFLTDLRYAARRLRQTPLFTLSAIAILALGIGLNTSVFSVVDALVLRPAPFSDPGSIVHIYQDSDEGTPSSTSFPAYLEMAANTDVFEGVAATSADAATWETTAGPRPVAVEYATASYLPVLGLQPYRGRWFSPENDRVGEEMAAVVSYHAWRTRLGGDPGVIGLTIRLNNQPVTIVGIGPREFNGEAGSLLTDFWLSISSTPVGGPFRVGNLERREDHWYQVVARLAPGIPLARADAAMDALASRLADAYPDLNRGRGISVFPQDEIRFHPDVDGSLLTVGVGLFTVAALVLLLACGNLGNLLLVRGIVRRPEMAVRQALGAARGRMMRLLVLEALLLSALGAAAGVGLAIWSLRLLPGLPLPLPGGGLDVRIDERAIVFSILLALGTGLVFGFLPSLRATRTDVAASLRDEGRGRSEGRSVSVLRAGLLILQVAVSLMLVVGAGLLTRTLANIQRADPGFDADRIALLSTDLAQGGVTGADAQVVVADLLARVEALPGVDRAGITTRLPLQQAGTTTQVVDGYRPTAGTGAVELDFAAVTPAYFETMGIPLLEGRAFTADDRPDSPASVIVNETAARIFWGGDAIGGRIRPESAADGWREVVGVVADSRVSSLGEAPTPMIYYPLAQVGALGFTLVARTDGDPGALLSSLRTALRDVRSTLPVTRLTTLEQHVGDGLAAERMVASLMGGFSAVALVLAALGVYAIVSFSVERRRRELGIRSALGAAGTRLVRTVVGETLAVTATGVLIGLGLAMIAARGLEGMLYGVGAFDVATFAGAAILLLIAASAAAFLPARRAARTDPVQALRAG